MKVAKNPFKKGTLVRFEIYSSQGTAKGKGTIVKLPPKNQDRAGMNRVTVRDKDGREWRPFVTKCWEVVAKAPAKTSGKAPAKTRAKTAVEASVEAA